MSLERGGEKRRASVFLTGRKETTLSRIREDSLAVTPPALKKEESIIFQPHPNSVVEYIRKNSIALQGLGESIELFTDTCEQWNKSPEVGEYADQVVAFRNQYIDPQEWKKAPLSREYIIETTLHLGNVGDVDEHLGMKATLTFMNAGKEDAEELDQKLLALRQKAQREILPLLAAATTSRENLTDELSDFVSSNYGRLRDFAELLTDEALGEERESITILLRELAKRDQSAKLQKQSGIFERAVTEIEEAEAETPSEVVYEKFLTLKMQDTRLEKRESKKDDETVILEENTELYDYFLFASGTGMNVNTAMSIPRTLEDVKAAMPNMQFWPMHLKQDYRQFLHRDMASITSQITRALFDTTSESAKRFSASRPTEEKNTFHKRRTNKVTTSGSEPRSISEVVITPEELKKTFGLGKLITQEAEGSIKFIGMNDREQNDFLEDIVQDFSPVASSQEDLHTAIQVLLKDPYPRHQRPGIKKLFNAHQSVGGTQKIDFDLYSFDPAKGSELHLSKQFPRTTRIVYFIDDRDKENPLLSLTVFTNHDAYVRYVKSKMTSKRR